MEKFLNYRSLYGKAGNYVPPSAFTGLVSHMAFKESSPVFSCRFNPDRRYSNIFAYCKENGEICFADTRKAKPDNYDYHTTPSSYITIKALRADENAIFDCQWQPSYCDRLLAASGNGTVSLWAVDDRIQLSTFRGHTQSIKSMSVCPDEPHLFATGSRDGSILVWDDRLSKEDEAASPVRSIRNAHVVPGTSCSPKSRRGGSRNSPARSPGLKAESVTAVLLHSKETVVSGSSSKETGIRFWDLRKIYSTKATTAPVPARIIPPVPGPKPRAGFTSFCTEPFHPSTLYASCTDNTIYAYSLTTKSTEPVRKYQGGYISTYYVQATVCPTAPYILSGSCGNSGGLIWSLDSSQPAYYLDGHWDDVNAVAWNDRFELLTFADDTWRVWKFDPTWTEKINSRPWMAQCEIYNRLRAEGPYNQKRMPRMLQLQYPPPTRRVT